MLYKYVNEDFLNIQNRAQNYSKTILKRYLHILLVRDALICKCYASLVDKLLLIDK